MGVTLVREKDYVHFYCLGEKEKRLPDKTRVDCLTKHVAYEYDWGYNWTEAVTQSLHYARMTGKQPGIVLIVENKDSVYIERIQALNRRHHLNIRVISIIKSPN